MPWETSNRRQRLPANWPIIRRRILARDGYRCVLCGAHATEVDHVNRGDDHRDENLRSLCSPCHGRKSGREGGAERARLIRVNNKRFRRSDPHPGLLEP